MNFEETVFELIANSGESKSYSMEAMKAAREKNMKKAEGLIALSEEKLNIAHKSQTHLIQSEAKGSKMEINILLIHAQDHLMNAITIKDLATEIIQVYKQLMEVK